MSKAIKMFLFLSVLVGCETFQRNYQIIDTEILTSFDKNIKIKGLLKHFPVHVSGKITGTISYLPADTPREYGCKSQNAEIIIIGNRADYLEDFKKAINDTIIYTTNYFSDNNFIIDIPELKRSLFPVEKCNKYYRDEMPIPYFENYDFGLGEKTVLKKQIKGEPRPRSHTVYVVPEDLKVYVIAAQAGNFWKFDCNENRPETLGKWKHGYSKGIAISDKTNKVVFWVIVW